MTLQNPLIPAPEKDHSDTTPAPAVGLTADDLARLRHSLDSSVSDNTRAMYNSAWRGFEKWAQARGNLSLPASPQITAAYLAHLAEDRGLSVATIRLHKAAMAAVHKTYGHDDPTDHEGVRRIMKGIARSHGRTQRQAKPLTSRVTVLSRPTSGGRRHKSRQDGLVH